MGSVRPLHVVNRFHANMASVFFLAGKYNRAKKYFSKMKETLTHLETQVREKFGATTLSTWKSEEAEFKRNVLDLDSRKELQHNPYDLPKPDGEYKRLRLKLVLTNNRQSRQGRPLESRAGISRYQQH